MSNQSRKQAFAPAQAVAAETALDFDANAEAFNAALSATGSTEVETAAAADAIAARADTLMGTPAHGPRQIAEKVRAYAWLHGLPHDLSNPTTQATIARGERDDAKGLLAIYLDLTSGGAGSPSGGTARLADLIAQANAAFQAHDAGCDIADDVKAANEGRSVTDADMAQYQALCDAREAALTALRTFVAHTPRDAFAKASALKAISYDDFADHAANMDAVIADLARLATARAYIGGCAWDAARERYERAVAAADHKTFPKTDEGDAAWALADDERAAAFGALVRTPAPDAEANRVKMRAILLEGHDESHSQDEPDTPDGLQRMLNEGGVDGSWPLVYVYQDAIRQSGDVTSPLLIPSRPTPAEEA